MQTPRLLLDIDVVVSRNHGHWNRARFEIQFKIITLSKKPRLFGP